VGFTATVDAYNKLHGCCKYERKELKATTTSTTSTKASCCKGGEEKCNHDMANKADCCKMDNGKDCCKCTKEGHKVKIAAKTENAPKKDMKEKTAAKKQNNNFQKD
jgi:hypothetical protein